MRGIWETFIRKSLSATYACASMCGNYRVQNTNIRVLRPIRMPSYGFINKLAKNVNTDETNETSAKKMKWLITNKHWYFRWNRLENRGIYKGLRLSREFRSQIIMNSSNGIDPKAWQPHSRMHVCCSGISEEGREFLFLIFCFRFFFCFNKNIKKQKEHEAHIATHYLTTALLCHQ